MEKSVATCLKALCILCKNDQSIAITGQKGVDPVKKVEVCYRKEEFKKKNYDEDMYLFSNFKVYT